jgi:hypothetical protein
MTSTKKERLKRRRTEQPTETPQAEAVTVAWLVSVMMVTLLDVAAVGLRIYIATAGATEQRTLLAGYSLHAAATTGFVSLLLAFAAFKLREEKPPPRVTMFSVFVAAAPMVALLVVSMAG